MEGGSGQIGGWTVSRGGGRRRGKFCKSSLGFCRTGGKGRAGQVVALAGSGVCFRGLSPAG
jgi:hypothetical protein